MTQPITEEMMLNEALTPTVAPMGESDFIDENMTAVKSQEMLEESFKKPHRDITGKMRFHIGLIRDDPQLQVEYFKRKGIDAQVGEDGEVLVAEKDGILRPFRGSEWSFQDFAEWIPEIIEGGAAAVLTAGKLASGAIAGSAGLAGASAISGAVTGGLEAAKQGVAISQDLRPGFDAGRIGTKAAAGAIVPGLMKTIGAGARAIGKGYNIARFGSAPAPIDKAGIWESARAIKAKPTPGMLSTFGGLPQRESVLMKSQGSPAGMSIRGQQAHNSRMIEETTEELVAVKSHRAGFSEADIGEEFLENVKQSVAKKAKPAEDIYNSINETLGDIPADNRVIERAMSQLRKDARKEPSSLKMLDTFEKQILPGTDSVADQKLMRTSLRGELGSAATPNQRKIIDKLYGSITKAREESFKTAIDKAIKEKSEISIEAAPGEAYKVWRKEIQRRYKSLSSEDKSRLITAQRDNPNEFGSFATADQYHAELGEGLDKLRDQAIKENPKMFTNTVAGAEVKDLKGNLVPTGAKQKKLLDLKVKDDDVEKLKKMQLDLKKADGIYANLAKEIQAALTKGKDLKLGVKFEAEQAIKGKAGGVNIPAEARQKMFLQKQDVAQVKAMKQLSPEAYETLVDGLKLQMKKQATLRGKGRELKISPTKVQQIIRGYSGDVAKVIFGENTLKKQEFAEKFYAHIPYDINPSGTATTEVLHKIKVMLDSGIHAALTSNKFQATAAYVALEKIMRKDKVNTDSNSTKLRKAEEKQTINRRGK